MKKLSLHKVLDLLGALSTLASYSHIAPYIFEAAKSFTEPPLKYTETHEVLSVETALKLQKLIKTRCREHDILPHNNPLPELNSTFQELETRINELIPALESEYANYEDQDFYKLILLDQRVLTLFEWTAKILIEDKDKEAFAYVLILFNKVLNITRPPNYVRKESSTISLINAMIFGAKDELQVQYFLTSFGPDYQCYQNKFEQNTKKLAIALCSILSSITQEQYKPSSIEPLQLISSDDIKFYQNVVKQNLQAHANLKPYTPDELQQILKLILGFMTYINNLDGLSRFGPEVVDKQRAFCQWLVENPSNIIFNREIFLNSNYLHVLLSMEPFIIYCENEDRIFKVGNNSEIPVDQKPNFFQISFDKTFIATLLQEVKKALGNQVTQEVQEAKEKIKCIQIIWEQLSLAFRSRHQSVISRFWGCYLKVLNQSLQTLQPVIMPKNIMRTVDFENMVAQLLEKKNKYEFSYNDTVLFLKIYDQTKELTASYNVSEILQYADFSWVKFGPEFLNKAQYDFTTACFVIMKKSPYCSYYMDKSQPLDDNSSSLIITKYLRERETVDIIKSSLSVAWYFPIYLSKAIQKHQHILIELNVFDRLPTSTATFDGNPSWSDQVNNAWRDQIKKVDYALKEYIEALWDCLEPIKVVGKKYNIEPHSIEIYYQDLIKEIDRIIYNVINKIYRNIDAFLPALKKKLTEHINVFSYHFVTAYHKVFTNFFAELHHTYNYIPPKLECNSEEILPALECDLEETFLSPVWEVNPEEISILHKRLSHLTQVELFALNLCVIPGHLRSYEAINMLLNNNIEELQRFFSCPQSGKIDVTCYRDSNYKFREMILSFAFIASGLNSLRTHPKSPKQPVVLTQKISILEPSTFLTAVREGDFTFFRGLQHVKTKHIELPEKPDAEFTVYVNFISTMAQILTFSSNSEPFEALLMTLGCVMKYRSIQALPKPHKGCRIEIEVNSEGESVPVPCQAVP